MYIHDDADMTTVVTTTAKAILEGARHVGKADRDLTEEQIIQLEKTIAQLQNMIEMKKKTHRT
jgi:hypothetical protein